MDTKEKNRGEAPARRPRPEGQGEKRPPNAKPRPQRPAEPSEARKMRRPEDAVKQRPRPEETELPQSVQQRNGAARTPDAQRRNAEQPRQKRAAEAPRKAPAEARPAAGAEAEPRRPAPRKGEPPRRRPAEPGKKRPPQKARRPRETDDTLSSKRRAYGNSKPKKKSSVAAMGEIFKQTAQRTAARAKARREGDPKKRHAPIPAPAVIYTQPQAFNRNRFMVQMMTVAAVVTALVLGLSVFFKVKTITVSGAEVYSPWAIREASGINEGDNLLSFGNARAGALIKANLPYVNKVRLGIKLPDTVNIIIEEEDVVYAIKAQDGLWWLITSDGRVVEQTNGGSASNYTQIIGVNLDNPIRNEKAIAAEMIPTETGEDGAPIPVAVTGAQRLNAALQILKALEENDIVGGAASVEVTRIEDIILWYGTQYQVNLGDSTRLDYKIACMNDVILQMSDYQSGVLDISFTIWPDKVGYTPFA